MKNRNARRAYLPGFAAADHLSEIDTLSVQDLVAALDLEREDPLLSPWRRSYQAAIRRALGN